MESGLLREFFGNFSTRGERYYFTQGEIEKTIRKLGNSDTPPGWRGPLVMIFGGVGGAGGPVGVGLVGAGGAMVGSQMGHGQWGQGGTDDWGGIGWQVAGGPDSRCWGWWGRMWVVGQEGQIVWWWGRRVMAGSQMGQEQWGQEGPDG